MSVDIQHFIDTVGQPIPGEHPAGVDAKYDHDYEAVTAQILKMTSMSSAEDSVDFETIALLATELLVKTTKDLNLAGYACLGLLQTEGYKGLAAGLSAYHQIIENFWEDLYPSKKRMKARLNALEWLNERVGDQIGSQQPKPAEAEAIQQANEALGKISSSLGSRVEGPLPSLANLRSALNEYSQKLAPLSAGASSASTTDTYNQDAAAQTKSTTPTPAASSPAPVAASTDVQEIKTTSDATSTIRKLSSNLRVLEPHNPLPYRIIRSLKWDPIRSTPPAKEGLTQIPGPRQDQVDSLAALFEAKNWAVLLNQAEAAFTDASGTFWLDLQRYVHSAMKNLGPDYASAAEAVGAQTGEFILRAKGLEELKFASKIHLANEQTREWLSKLAAAQDGQPKVTQVLISPTAQAAQKERRELPQVKEKIAANDLVGALNLIQDAIDSETSPKLRYLRRLDAAMMCLDADQADWSKALLENLVAEGGQFTMEQWEPELVRECQRMLVNCYEKLAAGTKKEQTAEYLRLAETAREKLFSLDIRLAISSEAVINKKS